ncbi:unnamed protein product [Lymnaea stagnalis]|uniref:Uncharacterized protein n=1 Tax=Lymnaea stagnalis TaxID=6523 RepID=A0AAV2HYD2_LYMST
MRLQAVLMLLCIASWLSGTESDGRKEPSQRLLTFLSLYSGSFGNAQQVKQELDSLGHAVHDAIDGAFRSVSVPALPDKLTFYLEQVVYGVVKRMLILVIDEDDMGAIRIDPYNFTDPTKYSVPGQFDVTKDFDEVRLEDLSPQRQECQIVYMQTELNVFVGTFPDCNCIENGAPGKGAVTLSCGGMTALVYWRESIEQDNILPYDFKKIVSYPLLPYIAPGAENFRPPCDCH